METIYNTMKYRSDTVQSLVDYQTKQCNDVAHLHPNQCPYQVSVSYTLQVQKYCPDKILRVEVTTAKSKVKSRSHHDVALIRFSLMFLPSINFYGLREGLIKALVLHTYSSKQCPYQVSASFTSEILRYK